MNKCEKKSVDKSIAGSCAIVFFIKKYRKTQKEQNFQLSIFLLVYITLLSRGLIVLMHVLDKYIYWQILEALNFRFSVGTFCQPFSDFIYFQILKKSNGVKCAISRKYFRCIRNWTSPLTKGPPLKDTKYILLLFPLGLNLFMNITSIGISINFTKNNTGHFDYIHS